MLAVTLGCLSMMLLKDKGSWYVKTWSLLVFCLISLLYLYSNVFSCLISGFVKSDILSSTLICLSLFITAVSMVASQGSVKVSKNSETLFSNLLIVLCVFLILAFSMSSLFVFYFMFEITLIPTLFLILGWGYQPERLQAGMYMMIYTIAASLPLLVIIMWLGSEQNCSNMMMYSFYYNVLNWGSWAGLVMSCLIFGAFLVKLPMFSVHLWLPKAHVEAPVAGSMVLAALLLKLGGYGLISVCESLSYSVNGMVWLIFTLGLWGGMLGSLISFRQIDLKSLIAYSSVGHMSLVLAGILSNSTWGYSGSVLVMISHGLTSSALFALANYTYEKTSSRSLLVSTGVLICLPILALSWFILSSLNMAAPPSINLLGELELITSIIFSSLSGMISLSLISFLACLYSMYMYVAINSGKSSLLNPYSMFKSPSMMLVLIHWLPANILILKSSCFW